MKLNAQIKQIKIIPTTDGHNNDNQLIVIPSNPHVYHVKQMRSVARPLPYFEQMIKIALTAQGHIVKDIENRAKHRFSS